MRIRKIGKIFARTVLGLLMSAVAAVLILALTVRLTPRLSVWYIRHSGVFSGKVAVPEAVEVAASRINIRWNVRYTSRYPDHTMDVYSPADASAPGPTLLWVHGGGFISGDKEGVKPFAMQMAQNGYTVVAVNYAVAPETTYPAAVVQTGEAFAYIRAHAAQFPTVDLSDMAFGGDSAGAQIVSQFAAVQTNSALAADMKLDPVLPASSLRAVVLYCGPYDLASFRQVDDRLTRFFIGQIGWAYFGRKDWLESKVADQVSTYDHVTEAYPPTFLTDGNDGSFEEQGQAFYRRLQSLGVSADALFYPRSAGVFPHEYQFNYAKYGPQADECLSRTLRFLNLHMKN